MKVTTQTKTKEENHMASLPQVLIIELGSQYTLLIERTLRELGVRSAILAPAHALAWLKKNPVRAVILSGGSSSVYDNDAPQPPKDLLSLVHEDGQPIAVLGICYGMQWLSQTLGGKVQAVLGNREYGETKIELTRASHPFFASTPREQTVWMSHGDSVISLPEGFNVLAYSDAGTIAAMQNGSVWGVQFHPEVVHTPHGKTMLANFLQFALCEKDWTPPSVVTSIQEGVGARLGNERVIFGFSGGVDSTTVSAMLAPVLKEKLLAVTIDGGQLREGELDEIRQHAGAANVSLRIMDARREFQEAMTNFVHVAEKWTWPVKLCVRLLNVLARHIAGYKGVVDAEEKRRRFREVYTSLLVRAAHDFGAHALLQGTLAPDRIESGATGGAMIKSHHNVGLRLGNLLELHPVDHLFKYEVRALAREIGLPERIWRRQPFPGPGLFLRVVGVPATPEKLDIVRWADARVREITERHGVYNTLSQLVVAYIGVNTVGVKGDGRAYGGAIVVRAVETTDFMTARGVHFSEALEDEISRVLTRSPAIVRVWYDPTNKPPATTEFE